MPVAAIVVVTFLAYLPVLHNGLVNWDDPDVFLRNTQLGAPGALTWAFTTTRMGHYQPVSWLVWSAVRASFGLSPHAFHALSLAGHLLNAVLVYFVALSLMATTESVPNTSGRDRFAALMASLIFAVHPLRVEVVAWASAFPYVLSLGGVLLSLLAYLRYRTVVLPTARRRWWFVLSLGAYAVSLLARANAIGFPFVLLAADLYSGWHNEAKASSHGRVWSNRPTDISADDHVSSGTKLQLRIWRLLLEKLSFVIVAVVVAFAESRSRELTTLQEVGAWWRVTAAATAPLLYLWRTLVPVGLSPLDALPIEPRAQWVPLLLACAGLAAITIVVVRLRTRWPALLLAWVTYLVLLAPVIGLTPTGQQATADRYTYLPGVVISLLAGALVSRISWRPLVPSAVEGPSAFARSASADRRSLGGGWSGGRATAAIALALMAALAAGTWRQLGWWHDSIALWTRAADLDPRNDIATYNLASALAEAGREDEAVGRYQQTLALVPDHEHARFNLNLILVSRAERDGDRLADAGRLDEALDAYNRALAGDATRMHARAARGLILMRRGRTPEAVEDLQAAFEKDDTDPAVSNALAYALTQTGRSDQAAAVLETAVARNPADLNLTHNLARLLATAPDPAVRNGRTALRLALAVRDRTGGSDPRVLDTLAAAYAETGRMDLARVTARQAIDLAERAGDPEMAREIAARARRYAK